MFAFSTAALCREASVDLKCWPCNRAMKQHMRVMGIPFSALFHLVVFFCSHITVVGLAIRSNCWGIKVGRVDIFVKRCRHSQKRLTRFCCWGISITSCTDLQLVYLDLVLQLIWDLERFAWLRCTHYEFRDIASSFSRC